MDSSEYCKLAGSEAYAFGTHTIPGQSCDTYRLEFGGHMRLNYFFWLPVLAD